MVERYEHSGTAAPTTLSGPITAASGIINILDSTGWPTGAVGPFWTTIERGESIEEKVLVLSRSGTALTVQTRGAEGTPASSHASGATIEHTLSATEIDELNVQGAAITDLGGTPVTTTAVQALANKDLSAGTNTFPASVVSLTGTQSLSNKTLVSPVITGDISGLILRKVVSRSSAALSAPDGNTYRHINFDFALTDNMTFSCYFIDAFTNRVQIYGSYWTNTGAATSSLFFLPASNPHAAWGTGTTIFYTVYDDA